MAAAEHGRARVESDPFEGRVERLNHNLFRVGQSINDKAESAALGIENCDEAIAFNRRFSFNSWNQQAIEKNERQQFAPKSIERGFVDPLDSTRGFLIRHMNEL